MRQYHSAGSAEREPLSQEEVCDRLRSVIDTRSIRRIVLFGSFARGTQTADSDVDMVVLVEDSRRSLDRYQDILPMLHRLLRPHPVAPLIYTEQEYAMMRGRPGGIAVTADAEGVPIHV